jgi:outer membrane protein OmpA-like peptidoglycan-associated protein
MRFLVPIASLVATVASGCGGGSAPPPADPQPTATVAVAPTDTAPPTASATVAVAPTASAPPAETEDADINVTHGARFERGRLHLPEEIEFHSGKATINLDREKNRTTLETLLAVMQTEKRITKLRIEGHTDNVGDAAANKVLSQQRAEAVASWLVAKGVEQGRLHVIGYGDTKPEVPNDSDQHRHQNRRTEFHIEEINGHPPHWHHHDH